MLKKFLTLAVVCSLLCALPTAAEAKKKIVNKNPAQVSTTAKKSSTKLSSGADTKVSVQQNNWRIKVAQQKLQVLQLYSEKPNGRMTSATEAALKKFQQQYKLKVSGQLDDSTYRKLNWEAFAKSGISNVQGQDVVKQAARYQGVPYKFGGVTPSGFDCSGYVQYVFKNCKANLPRVADEQVLEGVFVTQKQLKPGDLVFFTTYAPGASHVGIYAGQGKFWNASSSKGVMLCSLQDSYWKAHYYGARRVLVTNGEI